MVRKRYKLVWRESLELELLEGTLEEKMEARYWKDFDLPPVPPPPPLLFFPVGPATSYNLIKGYQRRFHGRGETRPDSEGGPDLDKYQGAERTCYGEQQIARGMAMEAWQCSRDIEKTCLLETSVGEY